MTTYSYDRQAAFKGDPEATIQKWMDHAKAPDKELIELAHTLEKAGKDEVVKFLDNAIDAFAKARSSLGHAKARL